MQSSMYSRNPYKDNGFNGIQLTLSWFPTVEFLLTVN